MGQRRWTRSAIECYLRGCVCEGCFYKDFFENSQSNPHKCKMKQAVFESVRVLGKPEGTEQKSIKE